MNYLQILGNNFKIETRNLISNQINATFERLREQMPCGFESAGIPPLAPLHVDSLDIDIEHESLSATGVLENIRIDGLNTFITRDVNFGLITLRVTFDFLIPAVEVAGQYNLNGQVTGIPFRGTGPFDSTAFDISMIGQARMGVTSGFLDLREFDLTFLIPRFSFNMVGLVGDDGQTSDFFNPLFEQLIPQWILSNQAAISAQIRDIVMPIGNNILNDMTVADLLDRLERGGSGEPSEPCVPTQIKFKFY